MGRHSQTKGKRFERLIAEHLKQLWETARKVPFNQSHRGDAGADVEGTPFWVETKHGKQPSIPAAYRQAVEATDGRPPLVVTRRNREDILVTMKLEDWLQWMTKPNNG